MKKHRCIHRLNLACYASFVTTKTEGNHSYFAQPDLAKVVRSAI